MAKAGLHQIFTLNVQTRKYKVVWKTEELVGIGEQVPRKARLVQISPGESGRVISYYAELILDSNDIQPADNFTCELEFLLMGIPKAMKPRRNIIEERNPNRNRRR